MMAILLVIAIPLAAMGLLSVSVAWARDAVGRAPLPGLIGVFCTLVAVGNLFVERTCDGMVNRPVITVALGDGDCYRTGVIGLGLVLLLGVATSAAVRVGDLRR